MMTKSHSFFLLNPSPWPLLSSFCSFNLMFSLLMFFKYGDFSSFVLGLSVVTSASFFWWFSYSGEFNLQGDVSNILESGLKFSMLLFISSEVFFFFSFFWSYFHFFLSPTVETGLVWPPFSVEMFDFLNVPLLNTVILLSSGLTVTISHKFLTNGDYSLSNFYLLLTFVLGVIFTSFQLMEYESSFFGISDSSFGTIFFVLTGFHGIHVLIGSVFLLVCLIRSLKVSSSKSSFLSFELASWYWHFVDVVWIFLFFLIYYLNN